MNDPLQPSPRSAGGQLPASVSGAGLHRKLTTADALAQQLRTRREAGKTVVQCHGCFDIVHPGHVRYLQFARQLGDVLVVSLTGDSQMSKGPDRPYIPQELRAENLAALEFVDYVVIDSNPTACELLERLRPNVYVKGREYAGSNDPRFRAEAAIVERFGGRVVFHSGDVVFSSTRLIRSLERDAHLDEVRLRTFCRRADIDQARLFALVEECRRRTVCVVGDVLRERYVLCDPIAGGADAPMMTAQALETREFWGGAAAVALQLAALGVRTRLITSTAMGSGQKLLRSELAALGVDACVVPGAAETPEQTTFIGDDAKLFRVYRGAACPLDRSREEQIVRSVQGGGNPDAILWCDYGYGTLSPALVEAVQSATTAGVRVGCAPGPRGEILAMRGVSVLITSERRMREALHDMGSGLPAVAWKLLSESDGQAGLVSLPKRGLVSFFGREPSGGLPERLQSEFVPAATNLWVDRIGVEEAIAAGAAAALACGATLVQASYVAGALEAIVGSRAGRTTAGAEELALWIAGRPELRPENRFFPDSATIGDIARIAPPLPMLETAGT
ncbi:MAG: adenylyltransferase/cytidyltransferase family protein [Planctomycetes bacterium]|nr:adenylyltransferase/cytidyltransferase family protein [Planctomycetota bacterium]